MKKFIYNIFLFILPILIFSYFGEIVLSKNLKKSKTFVKGEYTVWNDVLEGKVNSDIVIYGSSRAWVHINPIMMSSFLKKNVYNLGIDGQNFSLQYLRHLLFLKHNKKPKLIIHSLDVHTFMEKKGLYLPDQFLPYMLHSKEIKDYTIGYKAYSYPDYFLPFIRYYGKRDAINHSLKMISSPEDNFQTRIRGYQGKELIWNDDLENAKKKMKQYYVKIDSVQISLFEKYLNDCNRDGIHIILVYTPEYIKGQKFIKNRKEIIDLFEMLSKKFNIPFYDYSNDSLSFEKKYFYNSSHLNKEGAELFTMKLNKDIQKNEKSLLESLK